MKKTLITFALLASGSAFAAVTNFPGEDAIIQQDKKQALKEARIAASAETKRKNADKNPLLEDEKPANYGQQIIINKDVQNTSDLTSSKDVSFGVSYNSDEKTYRFEMFKNNSQALNEQDFQKLPTGNILESYWVNSNLQNIEKNVLLPNGKAYVFNITPKYSRGKCEAFYVRYQLRGDKDVTTRAIILNKDSLSVAKMPTDCDMLDEHWLDTIDFTVSGYTAGFNWQSPSFFTTKPVKYTTFFTKLGEESFPADIQSYAISQDFSHFYKMNQKLDSRGAFFGVQFSQNIEYPGTYLFITTFEDDNGKLQKLTAKNRVSPGTNKSEKIQLY